MALSRLVAWEPWFSSAWLSSSSWQLWLVPTVASGFQAEHQHLSAFPACASWVTMSPLDKVASRPRPDSSGREIDAALPGRGRLSGHPTAGSVDPRGHCRTEPLGTIPLGFAKDPQVLASLRVTDSHIKGPHPVHPLPQVPGRPSCLQLQMGSEATCRPHPETMVVRSVDSGVRRL